MFSISSGDSINSRDPAAWWLQVLGLKAVKVFLWWSAYLANPCYSVPRTHRVFLQKPFSSLSAAEHSVVPLVSVWVPCLPPTRLVGVLTGWWAVLMLSACLSFVSSLTFVWTETNHINTIRRPDEKRYVISLISGSFVQVISSEWFFISSGACCKLLRTRERAVHCQANDFDKPNPSCT